MSFFPGVALPNLKEGSGTEPSNGVPSLLLWLPNFPPSTRRAGSRRDYSSNPFSKLLRGCFNLEGKSHGRHLARIPESSSSWGRLDAGASPAHPRARAPLTDPGSEHAARFAKATSVRSANPWAGPCTPTFAHEGRQPWPPVRAHSPDKLPVALRSKHSRQLAAVAAGGCLRLCLRQLVSCYPFTAKRSTTESEILAATCFPPQTGLGIL